MRWRIKECATLAEYRECILRVTQIDIARASRTSQAWVSQIERGHLPRPKEWANLLRAYGLDRLTNGERHFVRLVETARSMRANQTNSNPAMVTASFEATVPQQRGA